MPHPKPPPPRLVARGSILLDLVTDENIDDLTDEQAWTYWTLQRFWRQSEAGLVAEEAPKKASKTVMTAASLAEEAPEKAIHKVMKAASLAKEVPKKAIKKVMKATA